MFMEIFDLQFICLHVYDVWEGEITLDTHTAVDTYYMYMYIVCIQILPDQDPVS